MWVPFLRSFPGNEAHNFCLGGAKWGFWVGGGKKFMLKKFMCFFRPLYLSPRDCDCEIYEGAYGSTFSDAGRIRFRRRRFKSAGPKRGCLNVGAWNPQESGRKAAVLCNAAVSMLHCSFSLVAAQLFKKKRLPHCRKANVAVQLLQRSIPKTAAQLPFSLVACCRGGV